MTTSLRPLTLAPALAACAILLLGWARVAALQSRLDVTRHRDAALQSHLRFIEALEARHPTLERELASLGRRAWDDARTMVDTRACGDEVGSVVRSLQQAGLSVQQAIPTRPRVRDGWDEIPLDMGLEGSLPGLATVARQVASRSSKSFGIAALHASAIGDVRLGPVEPTYRITMQLTRIELDLEAPW